MKKFFFIICCCCAFILSSSLGYALTSGPTVLDFELDPGGSQELSMMLFNERDEPVIVMPTLFRVSGADENGFPSFERMAPDADLVRMISFPSGERHALAAKERKDIPIRVSAEEGYQPGGYYAVLSWGAVDGFRGVSLSGQPAVNIAISLRGEVERGMRISRFSTSRDAAVIAEQPIVFMIDVENTGGVHFSPVGVLNIRNMFGMAVAHIPLEEARVLPHTTRTFTARWSPTWALGFYSAAVDFNAGEQEAHSDRMSIAVVSPLALSISGIIMVCALVIFLFRILKQ